MPGRFGLSIPIELLARTCRTTDFTNLAHVLRGFDLISAFEDWSGRIVVGPRHRLEAQLIVQARVGNVQDEAAIVSRIIRSVRSSDWPDESDEMDFVIDFLQQVGPRGDERPRFAPAFRELASAISEVREVRNVKNPRLMLQEAHLLREWIMVESNNNSRPPDTREVLEEAESILEEALDMLGDGGRHRRLRTFVATELASTFGTATIDSIHEAGATGEEIQRNFRLLLDAVRTARKLDSSAYNPVDVLAWSTLALAGSGMVDDITRTEAIVDVLDALGTVDRDLLEFHNAERLNTKKYEVAKLLGDEELSEFAFQNLIDMKSAAGFYIRALEISGALGGWAESRGVNHERYKDAWDYLELHRAELSHDARCLNLLFDYWWLAKTGSRLFESERMVLPFDNQDWLYTLELIRQIRSLDAFRDLTFSLLEAIALFHINLIPQSLDLLREVESRSDTLRGRRRIQRFFLAAGPDGTTRSFHGNVQWVDQNRPRGGVYVDELRRVIPFIPTDFGRPDIRRGDPLGEFHIAFNFIGAIADRGHV